MLGCRWAARVFFLGGYLITTTTTTVRTETVRGAIAVGVSRSRSVARNRGTAGRVVAGRVVAAVGDHRHRISFEFEAP